MVITLESIDSSSDDELFALLGALGIFAPKINPQWFKMIVTFVLAALIGAGCGRSGFLQHLEQVRDDTKRRYKAVEIKAAVLAMFAADPASTNAAPRLVTTLPIFSDDPTNIVTGNPLGNTNILAFTIGSGFGHWGIIVCHSEEGELSLTNDTWFRPRITLWQNGVYFYSDYR